MLTFYDSEHHSKTAAAPRIEDVVRDYRMVAGISSGSHPGEHPDRHGDHAQILGQRDEAERHVGRAAYAGAFEITPVEVDGLEHGHRAHGADEQRYRDGKPIQRVRDHEHARKPLGERIENTIWYPALRQQVVVEEHGRELPDVLQLEQREDGHAEAAEPLERECGEGRTEDRMAGRDREQRCHRKQRGDGAVTGRSRLRDGHAEVAAQIVVAADAHAVDEHLRRRPHAMCGLERVGLFARGEVAVIHREALAPEKVERLQSVRAGVRRHHHAVEDGFGTV